MGNIERQLRQTIDEQEKEICRLKDQVNKLGELNNSMWNLYNSQMKELIMLRKEVNRK